MSKKIDGFSREKYIEMTVQITAGLLASGHFTGFDDDPDVWPLWDEEEKKFIAVYRAEEILESIIGGHDALTRQIENENKS